MGHAATDETGAATVEFVVVFPIFLLVFLSCFEASLLLTRQLMLERAIDVVMRDVRLSTGVVYPHWQLRRDVCERATILPDCDRNLVLEITQVDRTTYDMPSVLSPCVDRATSVQAYSTDTLITQGNQNDLMLVRACFVVDPVFPGAGLGLELVRGQDDGTRMVAASAFVQEPAAAPGS